MSEMYFGPRQLKPYAEPVSVGALDEDEIYYIVSFLDEEMLIPEVSPVVYLKDGIDGGDEELVYFRDAESFLLSKAEGNRNDYIGSMHSFRRDELGNVYTFDNALDVLLNCSLRRVSRTR